MISLFMLTWALIGERDWAGWVTGAVGMAGLLYSIYLSNKERTTHRPT